MEITGVVASHLLAALKGAELGQGTSRMVYEVQGDPNLVVKEGTRPPYHSNCTEWNVWLEVRGTVHEHTFGRCHAISDDGKFLVMERLNDLDASDRLKDFSAPRWLTDRKPDARGKTNSGAVKVRDYGQVSEYRDMAPNNILPWPQADQQMLRWSRLPGLD